MADVFEEEETAAVEDVKGLLHVEVAVDGNAGANGDLLYACRCAKVLGAGGGCLDLDEDVAAIAEVDEVFALAGIERVALFDAMRFVPGMVPERMRVLIAIPPIPTSRGTAYIIGCVHG